MKTQMRFQKILALVSLIISALCIVLAVVFMSGNLADIMYYAVDYEETVGSFTTPAQLFCNVMLIMGIVYLCCVLTLYITDTNKRRNYYITNYISTGLAALGALVAALFGFIMISILVTKFYALDWEEISALYEAEQGMGGPNVGTSPAMFIVGYIILIFPLLDVAALILNLVWKIKLMKGEKALLEQGFVKEVA